MIVITVILGGGALLSAAYAIWAYGLHPLINAVNRIHAFADKVDALDNRMVIVETHTRQLTNNGGSHMRDAVDRIERALTDHILDSVKVEREINARIFDLARDG